jgi:hypothetical protein
MSRAELVDFTGDVDWRSKDDDYFPHQRHALGLIRERFRSGASPAVLLVMPMGSGKTRVVGGLCRDYKRSLVVVPPQLIPQIADLLREGGAGAPGAVLEAATGKELLKISLASEESARGWIVVTSFKIAGNVFGGDERHVSNHYDFMVVDEAHLLPNATTRFFPDGQPKRALFMTATPVGRTMHLADVAYQLGTTTKLRNHCGMDQDVLFTAVTIELSHERLLAYWQELLTSAVHRACGRDTAPNYCILAHYCHRALERLLPLGERGRDALDVVLAAAIAEVPRPSFSADLIVAMTKIQTPAQLATFNGDNAIHFYEHESRTPRTSFRREHNRWWTANCWGAMPSIVKNLERGTRLVYVVDTLAEVEHAAAQFRAASVGRAVHAGSAKCPGHRLGVVLHHDRGERYKGSTRSAAKHLDGGHWPMRLQKKLLTSTRRPPRHKVLGNFGIAELIWQYLAPPAYIFVVSRDTITVGFNLQNHADGMLCSRKPGKSSSTVQLAGRWVRANGLRRSKPPQIFYPLVAGTDEDPSPPSLLSLLRQRDPSSDDD